MAGATTITEQLSVKLPSLVVTVIVAEPAALAVTVPLLTEATLELVLDQVTFLFVALVGATVAVNVELFPTTKFKELVLRETPVTGTAGVELSSPTLNMSE